MDRHNAKILIVFAWAMEIVGVSCGVVNSAYTTFGDDFPTTFTGYLPVIPMVALAVAEMGRIPLASAIFHKKRYMQVIAAVGILSLGYLAVENWTFGFERIVNLRLKNVEPKSQELAQNEATLKALVEQRQQISESSNQKRAELRGGIAQRDSAIKDASAQSEKEDKAYQANMTGIKEACRLSPYGDNCMASRMKEEAERHTAEKKRIGESLTTVGNEQKALQAANLQYVGARVSVRPKHRTLTTSTVFEGGSGRSDRVG
jgi:hypothetical protein